MKTGKFAKAGKRRCGRTSRFRNAGALQFHRHHAGPQFRGDMQGLRKGKIRKRHGLGQAGLLTTAPLEVDRGDTENGIGTWIKNLGEGGKPLPGRTKKDCYRPWCGE